MAWWSDNRTRRSSGRTRRPQRSTYLRDQPSTPDSVDARSSATMKMVMPKDNIQRMFRLLLQGRIPVESPGYCNDSKE
jgi:hypothetical protein